MCLSGLVSSSGNCSDHGWQTDASWRQIASWSGPIFQRYRQCNLGRSVNRIRNLNRHICRRETNLEFAISHDCLGKLCIKIFLVCHARTKLLLAKHLAQRQLVVVWVNSDNLSCFAIVRLEVLQKNLRQPRQLHLVWTYFLLLFTISRLRFSIVSATQAYVIQTPTAI